MMIKKISINAHLFLLFLYREISLQQEHPVHPISKSLGGRLSVIEEDGQCSAVVQGAFLIYFCCITDFYDA